ncbi:MAG: sel1 repeat family protein [Methylobacillus sp.]|nr:sel1 repeat family protein [Methylobacillus sp.]
MKSPLTDDEALVLYAKARLGDEAARKLLTDEAERGDKIAQRYLGRIYDFEARFYSTYDDSVEQASKQAAYWYRKAAEQGDAWAQNDLGTLYVNGLGVPQDYAQAVQWFRKAAEQGEPRAMLNLGWNYGGLGVPEDYAQAAQWFRKAVEQNDYDDSITRDALSELCGLYEKGHGVPQSKVAAYALCTLSDDLARQLPEEARIEDIEEANRAHRIRLDTEMTPQEIETAKKLVPKIDDAHLVFQSLDEYLKTQNKR